MSPLLKDERRPNAPIKVHDRLAESSEDIATALNVTIPDELLALLGIPAGALVGTPMIRSFETTGQPDAGETDRTMREIRANDPTLQGNQTTAGQIVVNESPMDARLGDIFRGEETGNAAKTDIGKIQMALFTVGAWLAYAFVVGAHLNNHTPSDLVDGIVEVWSATTSDRTVAKSYEKPSDPAATSKQIVCDPPPKPLPSQCVGLKVTRFPSIAEGMIWILLVSHGGYLTAKAVPNSKKGGGPSAPGGGGGGQEFRLVLRGRR